MLGLPLGWARRAMCLSLQCFFVLTCCETAQALDPSRAGHQYKYDDWTTQNGLPYAAVHTVFQSSQGYLWIGTRGGAARFDGLTFTQYTHANTPELVDDEVLCFSETSEGTLWMGT